MTRPSRHTDQKLIRAALALLPTTGYTRLSMRAVAAKAGVNLGMFHYYFKNKEEFTRRVADEFYATFFNKFTLEVETGKNPKEQLRKAILTLMRFFREHRRLLFALGRDVLEGDHTLVPMMESLLPRHGVILIRLMLECKKQGLIADIPIPIIITFILGSIAGPIAVLTVLERIKLHPPLDLAKKVAIPFMLSDQVMEQRLDLALRALEPGTTWKSAIPNLDKKVVWVLNRLQAKYRLDQETPRGPTAPSEQNVPAKPVRRARGVKP